MAGQIVLTAVPNIPHIQKGDDLVQTILTGLQSLNINLQDGDILTVAQKIVSKSEGRKVLLSNVSPSERALQVGAEIDKDPRLVELILQESDEISRMRKGVLIVRHKLGFTSANAGIDRSNIKQPDDDEVVLLLPEDPDDSAERLRQTVRARLGVDVGVVITDSHGRPFRMGQTGVAIGVAGIPALWDRRGDIDLFGYVLKVTEIAVADEIAAAADLLMGPGAEGIPVVLLRGLRYAHPNGKATDLVRPKEQDLYR